MLGRVSNEADERVLVDMRTADDAGVMLVGKRRALVHTIDVITPIVDDPRAFGRIAAANSISDVYAMGGKPTSAVSLLGLPKELPLEALAEIFAGAQDVLREAKTPLLGGHTVKDKELKLGFAVTGLVDPKKMTANTNGEAGEVLVLTKPLGTGVLYQAMKKEVRTEEQSREVIASMSALNKRARKVMIQEGVRCATDVTGFGLIGHALNIARGSNVDIMLYGSALPAFSGVLEYLAAGVYPGTINANLSGYGDGFVCETGDEARMRLAADPQTSGGMLIAAKKKVAARIAERLSGWIVGELVPVKGEKPAVRLIA
jgi:selenide,water dikinase